VGDPGKRLAERLVQRPIKCENNCCLNNSKKKCTINRQGSRRQKRNDFSKEYEHHFAFLVTETGSSVPVPEKNKRSFHLASTPSAAPIVDGGYFTKDLELELHEENKNLHSIL
jgi:hypothetical protein